MIPCWKNMKLQLERIKSLNINESQWKKPFDFWECQDFDAENQLIKYFSQIIFSTSTVSDVDLHEGKQT